MQNSSRHPALMLAMFAFAAQAQSLKYYGSAPTDPLPLLCSRKNRH